MSKQVIVNTSVNNDGKTVITANGVVIFSAQYHDQTKLDVLIDSLLVKDPTITYQINISSNIPASTVIINDSQTDVEVESDLFSVISEMNDKMFVTDAKEKNKILIENYDDETSDEDQNVLDDDNDEIITNFTDDVIEDSDAIDLDLMTPGYITEPKIGSLIYVEFETPTIFGKTKFGGVAIVKSSKQYNNDIMVEIENHPNVLINWTEMSEIQSQLATTYKYRPVSIVTK